MRDTTRGWFGWVVLPLAVLGCCGSPAAAASKAAPAPASATGLPDFDARHVSHAPTLAALPGRAAAAKPALPGADVRYDSLTGAASRVSRPGGVLTGPSRLAPATIARRFLADQPALFQLKDADVSALYTSRQYASPGLGVTHLWLSQQVNGIPVFKGTAKFDLTDQGELLAASGSLIPRLRSTLTAIAPRLAAGEALAQAAGYAGLRGRSLPGPVAAAPGARRSVAFGKGTLFGQNPVVELAYFPTAKGVTSLAWDVTLAPNGVPDVYHLLVDATTGALLFRKNYTHYASGQVYDRDSPQDGTPYTGSTPAVLQRVVKPFDGSDTFNGTALFPAGDQHFDWWAGSPANDTRSNNTQSGPARGFVYGSEPVPPAVSGTNGDFSFALDLTQNPSTYLSAATTNLFYWNNRCHDVWYRYGFDEAAGNFQTNNFGRGGNGSDAVISNCQFGADNGALYRNNANFSTPPDGQPGRMRMFIFDITNPQRDGDFEQEVIVHEFGHGVTNRLIGNGNGLSGFQGGSMGEGWSDFQALMIMAQSADDVNGRYPVGGYLVNDFARGIRSQPYSTNVNGSVFTRTYRNIGDRVGGGPEVHLAGEIICNALFQTYGKLVGRLQFQAGRDRMMQLFIDACKLCPDEPTFLDFRDKLVAADQTRYAGADISDIWAAFASRGMGASASTTGPDDTNPTEAFDLPVPTYSISGRVTQNGSGMSGVTVGITGPGTVTATQSVSPGLNIPDGGASSPGPVVQSSLSVSQSGTLQSVSVRVDITHTFRGDLTVALVHPDSTRITLFGVSGGSADSTPNIHQTFNTAALNGKQAGGTWRLEVQDQAAQDVGTLDSWSLTTGVAGTVTRSVTTDSSGNYRQAGLRAAAYTVAPSASGVTFTPQSRSVTITNADVTGVDFSAGAPSFGISGTVTVNGAGLSGVTVSAGSTTATTNASGAYAITGLAAGTYTVTPARSGYTFTPANRSISLSTADAANVNFTAVATPSTYSITGTVTLSGSGLGGVTITAGSTTAATNSAGVYTISGLAAGTYTVTPAKPGYGFSPLNRSVTLTTANATGVNFSANPAVYSISGTITANGTGLSGVTVTAGGRNATTASNGAYTLTGLAAGTFTVVPSRSGYSFTPANRSVTISTSSPTGIDFSATVLTYSLSGTITAGGSGLGGVTVTAGGRSATTASSGAYSIPGLPSGSYTVTPTKSGFSFSPTSRSVTISGANVTGVNFGASPNTFSISGTVTQNGLGVTGVTVTAGSGTATSGSGGAYTIPGLAAATYTVTPSKTGLAFTPISRSVTVSASSVTGVNFTAATATQPTFTLRNGSTAPGGAVTLQLAYASNGAQIRSGSFDLLFDTTKLSFVSAAKGALPAGVTVSASTVSTGRVRIVAQGTSTSGAWATGNILAITVRATAAASGVTTVRVVLPGSITAGVRLTRTTGTTLDAGAAPGTVTISAAAYSISGRVTLDGAGLAGITFAAGGRTATTAADGTYSLTGLAAGTYTLAPNGSGYTFTPASRSVTVGPSATGQSFTAASVTYAIRGSVRQGTAGLGGVTVRALRTTTVTGNASPALPIPDNNSTGVESSISISGAGTLSSVRVTVNITHTWRGDLEVSLVAPDGTTLKLYDGPRNDGTSGLVTSFPDRMRPVQSLDALVGKSAAGTWKLRIRDRSAPDRGTLNSWGLVLGASTLVKSVTTNSTGAYAITGLRAGTYSVEPDKSGFDFTPATRSVTVGPDATGVDFSASVSLSAATEERALSSVAAAPSGRAVRSADEPSPEARSGRTVS